MQQPFSKFRFPRWPQANPLSASVFQFVSSLWFSA